MINQIIKIEKKAYLKSDQFLEVYLEIKDKNKMFRLKVYKQLPIGLTIKQMNIKIVQILEVHQQIM